MVMEQGRELFTISLKASTSRGQYRIGLTRYRAHISSHLESTRGDIHVLLRMPNRRQRERARDKKTATKPTATPTAIPTAN